MTASLKSWLPLLILPLIAVIAAVVIVIGAQKNDDSPITTSFPSPRPVTFVPPTPEPTGPRPTLPPPPESVMDRPAPDFTLTTLDGGSIRLPDLAGEIVFLNFWATWCAPCQNEMPLLQTLHDDYGADGVRVIAVTNPDDGQNEAGIRAFVEQHGLTLTVALETAPDIYTRFEVAQIPITFILDRSGVVRYRHIGELHADDVQTYLERLGVGDTG